MRCSEGPSNEHAQTSKPKPYVTPSPKKTPHSVLLSLLHHLPSCPPTPEARETPSFWLLALHIIESGTNQSRGILLCKDFLNIYLVLPSAVLDQVLIISSPDYCNYLITSLSFPPASVVFGKYDDGTSQLKTGLWFPYPSKKSNLIHYCGTNVLSCSCLLIYTMESAGVRYDMW